MIKITKLQKNQFNEFVELFNEYRGNSLNNTEIENFQDIVFQKNSILEVFIAKNDVEILGFMILVKNFSTYYLKYYYYLQDFFVSSKYRSQGIGTLMFDFLTKYSKEKGYPRISWITSKENIKAQKFYDNYNADKSFLYYKLEL